MFDKHRNADGTYNGAGVLSEVSGLSTTEVATIAGQVKANREKLNSCQLHDFQPMPNCTPLRQRYLCKKCGGEVDHSAYHWYANGLAHSK